MIYQYVKRYLKNTLKVPTQTLKWELSDNIDFFAYIDKRYTPDEFTKEISEVKTAFKDFFEPIGNIVFRYRKERGIKFKIFTYKVKPENSKHLQKIIKMINQDKKYIQHPYQGQNNQIVILGKIRKDINKELFDTQESINVKELIKYAIRIALNLSEKDVVTQLKRKFLIKIFNESTVLDISKEVTVSTKEKDEVTIFNGYTAEQIEETYKEIFVKGDANIKYFLRSVMRTAFQNALNFRVMKNKFYEAKSLKIIHQIITIELNNYIELEKDYLLGLSGYLMRKNFQQIHRLMAIELIECIHEQDINANNFLLFYNGKTIVVNNKKYLIPSLETEEGKQWNNTSLIGICNLWMNTKKRKESYEHKLMDTEMKLDEIDSKLISIKPEKDSQAKVILTTEKKLEIINRKHTDLEKKLKYLANASLNSSEYFSLKKEVLESNTQIIKLKNIITDAKVTLRTIKNANINMYSELDFLTKQKQKFLQDIKSQTLNIESKSSQIDPIIESIVRVLMDRIKLVD